MRHTVTQWHGPVSLSWQPDALQANLATLSGLVWSQRRATVAQIASGVRTHSAWQVAAYGAAYPSGMCYNGYVNVRNGQWRNRRRLPGRSGGWLGACVFFKWKSGRMRKKVGWRRQCFEKCSGMIWGTKSLRCFFGHQILQISIWFSIYRKCWTNKSNPCPRPVQDLKDLLPNVLVPETTGHVQSSCGVHASTYQSCFGSTKGTYTI